MIPEIKGLFFRHRDILGAFAFWGCRNVLLRRVIHRRRLHGVVAEAQAAGILKTYGYRLIEEQVSVPMQMEVDGLKVPYVIRPDGIAQRNGERFLVEIKTGAKAGDLNNPLTRRQLFEYYFSTPCAGILFVKPDSRTVQTIRFSSPLLTDAPQPREAKRSWASLFGAFVLGATAATLVILYQ